MATIGELLAAASIQLGPHSDSPRLDAEVLLAHVLARSRSYLFTWPERVPADSEQQCFQTLVVRRAGGEPIAYLTGVQEFWSLPLAVSPATLIPRADSEVLVAAALERLARPCARVLDLGTGTGAIALALASERPGWAVVAVDREATAATLARRNRDALGLDNVEVLISDWFAALTGQFDLIVGNPPYIAPDDPHLEQGDVRHEPRSALVANHGGLADLTHIVAAAPQFLAPGGLLMLEHGAAQGPALRKLFAQRGYGGIDTLADIAGHERVTVGERPG